MTLNLSGLWDFRTKTEMFFDSHLDGTVLCWRLGKQLFHIADNLDNGPDELSVLDILPNQLNSLFLSRRFGEKQ